MEYLRKFFSLHPFLAAVLCATVAVYDILLIYTLAETLYRF